jgi:hypothetical protein
MDPLIVLLQSRVGEVFASAMAIFSGSLQYSQIRRFGGLGSGFPAQPLKVANS